MSTHPLDVFLVSFFLLLSQKADSLEKITAAPTNDMKKAALEYRRCIILGIVGSTSTTSPALELILANGYLDHVKIWLDDILSGTAGEFFFKCSSLFSVDFMFCGYFFSLTSDCGRLSFSLDAGGMDLLLQLLSTIVHLPVTKSIVRQSGMGKAIGTVEKHRICKDTPNEAVVKERVQSVKDAWYASVKARKIQDAAAAPATGTKASTSAGSKRDASSQMSSSPATSPVGTKRVKTEESTNKQQGSNLSSLLKRVSGAKNGFPSASAAVAKKPTPDKSQSQTGKMIRCALLGFH